MVQALANGRLVLEGEIHEPREGPWTARLELDAEEGDLDGALTLEVGSARFVGFATGEVEGGRTLVRAVGGAGGLRRLVDARYYHGTTVREVAVDVLREAGEALDTVRSSAALLAKTLPRWSRTRGEARAALSELTRDQGAVWRVTREGKVALVDMEAWPTIAMEHVVTRRDPAAGTVEVSPEDAPLVEPGTRLGDDQAELVRTEIEPGTVRQTLTLPQERPVGAARQLADQAERAAEARLVYARFYPSVVVRQHGDDSVDLMPDDARVRGNGLSEVPLRHGIPGLRVKVVVGQRVLLFFEGGDPKAPAAALWPDGSSVAEVVLEAGSRVVLEAPTVLVGAGSASEPLVLGQKLVEWLTAHTHPTAMGPTSAPIEAPTLPTVLSQAHKLDR